MAQQNAPNPYTSVLNLDSTLANNLHVFLHLADQAPVESVCKSALYLLDHVPATKQAVLDYLGTLYKVFTVLYLQCNQSQRTVTSADQIPDTTDINRAVELIDTHLATTIERLNQRFANEIATWLVELLGSIVCETGVKFSESNAGMLTAQECQAFRFPSILDGLEIWSNQCKTSQSILALLKKCFAKAASSDEENCSSELATSNLLDIVLNASQKYASRFDWLLCYLTGLGQDRLFEKLLDFNFKESSEFQNESQPFPRINVINFYSQNYSGLVCDSTVKFLTKLVSEPAIFSNALSFLLRLGNQSPALLIILADEILSNSCCENKLMSYLTSQLLLNEKSISNDLFSAIKSLNNSTCVYDLLNSILDWLNSQSYDGNLNPDFSKFKILINNFLEDLTSSVYLLKSEEDPNKAPLLLANDIVPFLKSLNAVNGNALKSLIDKATASLQAASTNAHTLQIQELVYKFLILVCINGTDNTAKLVISELFVAPVNPTVVYQTNPNETFLVKLRQEVNPFHERSFSDCVRSLIRSRASDEPHLLDNFVQNLSLIHEWDLQNPNFMTEKLANALVDNGVFTGLVQRLTTNSSSSLSIMILLNKVLNSSEEDYQILKPNVDHLLVWSKSFVCYFIELCNLINEDSVPTIIKCLEELLNLLKNTLIHISALENEDANPYRNILVRNLIEAVMEPIVKDRKGKTLSDDVHALENEGELIDEEDNLFNSNVKLINSELAHKSRLKMMRNTLASHQGSFKKHTRTKVNQERKSIRNLVTIDFLDIVCSKYDFFEEKQKKLANLSEENFDLKTKNELLSEQLSNVADTMVQGVLLEQFYIDYQWPCASLPDVDENFETELDAIKLFIERDMHVQKFFENELDDPIMWLLLEYVSTDESAFFKASPLVKSLLGALILQWESYSDQPARNLSKTFRTTMRLLHVIDKTKYLPEPVCYLVDIIPLLSSYETHMMLLIVWRNLKRRLIASRNENVNLNETKHLRFVFQKNIGKLAPLYSKFFSSTR